jgi:hypothetical protein
MGFLDWLKGNRSGASKRARDDRAAGGNHREHGLDVDAELAGLEARRGYSHETARAVTRLLEAGALEPLEERLAARTFHPNVRENVVNALILEGNRRAAPAFVLSGLRYADDGDLALESRAAMATLAQATQPEMVELLCSTKAARTVHVLCGALAEVGTAGALPALASVPDVGVAAGAALSVAARRILERLSQEEVSRVAREAGRFRASAEWELERREREQEVRPLLARLSSDDPDVLAATAREIGAVGATNVESGNTLRGDLRVDAIRLLRAVVESRHPVNARRAAHDALRAIGESPGGFLP